MATGNYWAPGVEPVASRSHRAAALSHLYPEAMQLTGDFLGTLELPPVRASRKRDEAGPGSLRESLTEAGRRVGIILAPEHEARRRDAPQIGLPFRPRVDAGAIQAENAALHGGVHEAAALERVGLRYAGRHER